jgi:hypothetical protein
MKGRAVMFSISTALYPLALLACPVGMGAMMFFMMRGGSGKRQQEAHGEAGDAHSLAELKAEHARLADEIERLDQPTASSEAAKR